MASAHPSAMAQLTSMTNLYAQLPEQQRQMFLQTIANNPDNLSPPSPLPEGRPSTSLSASPMAPFATPTFGTMNRVQSAPVAAMAHAPLASAVPNNLRRSSSTMTSPPFPCDEQSSAVAVFSSADVNEYAVDEWVANFMPQSSSPSLSFPPPSHLRQLHLPLTPNAQMCPSLDGSTSPSTPSTALTPVTLSSADMSRQGSMTSQMFDDVSMLRGQSQSSFSYSVIPEDASFPFSDVDVKGAISNCADTAFFPNFPAGLPSEHFISNVSVPTPSVSALVSSENQPNLEEDMRRSASTSGESTASNASVPSPNSRRAQRNREIKKQSDRCLAPAPKADSGNGEIGPISSNAQMMRIQSADGSSKNVALLTKAPYVRPQHPKIKCQHCNEKPDGFRGTHELERHIARAHRAIRKGYICVDSSEGQKFLANCKHCRNKKVYGAYYNAAAHLRRAHFFPRKRGRKGKHDEKRGGMGGGDQPPMDYLRAHWIQEVEVENRQVALSPESIPDSIENDGLDSSYDMNLVFSQPPNDVVMTMDASQPIDYTLCIPDFGDFNFDAYVPPPQ